MQPYDPPTLQALFEQTLLDIETLQARLRQDDEPARDWTLGIRNLAQAALTLIQAQKTLEAPGGRR
jgi:hypothetical protein